MGQTTPFFLNKTKEEFHRQIKEAIETVRGTDYADDVLVDVYCVNTALNNVLTVIEGFLGTENMPTEKEAIRLRDEFAMSAMNALLNSENFSMINKTAKEQNVHPYDCLAVVAYTAADAMIRQR